MKEKNTSDRLKEIMAKKGLRQIDILNKAIPFCKKYNVKLGRNDLSQYISGKVEPSQKKLTVLAEALEVSEAWLLGYDPMEYAQKQKIILFRETFKELLNYYKITKEEFSQKANIDIKEINNWLNCKNIPKQYNMEKICNFFKIDNKEDFFDGTIYFKLLNKYTEVFNGPITYDRYQFGFVLESMLDDISQKLNISTAETKECLFKRFKINKELNLLCEYKDLYDFLLEYLEKELK